MADARRAVIERLQLIAAKNYKAAYDVLKTINDERDIRSILDECLMGLKYENYMKSFDKRTFKSDFGGDETTVTTFVSVSKVEQWLAENIYQIWYASNGTKMEIDQFTFMGKNYVVKYACEVSNAFEDRAYAVVIELLGDINKTFYLYAMEMSCPVSDYKNEPYVIITVNDRADVADYFDKTPEQMAELNRKHEKYLEELAAREPNYSDETIVDQAFEAFMNRMRNNVTDIREILYISGVVKTSSVTYDWYTRTYTCFLEVEYHPNPFDFYGFTWQYYDVYAEYVDNGYGLVQTVFYYY